MSHVQIPQPNLSDPIHVVPDPVDTLQPLLVPVSEPPVVTISAAEMVRLTGVGRERLRTWERRHDFPQPVRCRNNVRRYPAGDVRHVISVSRAVDQGVPLAEAIQNALAARGQRSAPLMLGAPLDHAPAPCIALTGPEPLTVAWVNGTTAAAPESPVVGADLLDVIPGFGAAARATIQRLLIGDGSGACVVTHTDWTSTFPTERQSMAWRLPADVSGDAVVVLMQLPEIGTSRPAVGGHGSSASQQAAVWGSAAREARRALQQEPGLASAQRALSELVKGTGGSDAFLATFHSGQMRTATSVRGTIAPQTLPLSADCDVARAISDAEVDWVGTQTLRLLGVPPRTEAIVVPIIAGSEPIGAMFLLFPDELPLADVTRELLQSLATTIGAVLQREHHAAAVESARASHQPSAN